MTSQQPGGWGYDKDIAASLDNIDESLSRLVDLLERKEDSLQPAEDVGMMLLAGSLIVTTLDSTKLNLLEKHTRLRDFAKELLQRAKEKDGKTIQVQEAVQKDTEKR